MLYSAGMGAGILLRAVQEPVFMRENPPYSSALNTEILALEYTFYQWGFTPWAFYGIFATVLGYSLFIGKKKVLLSSSFQGLIRNKIALKGIDVITIITTVFGLIAAIALGATQITGGLEYLTSNDYNLTTTIAITAIISFLSFISAWRGLRKGIKLLSVLNISLTFILLFFVFICSDMMSIIKTFFIASGHYIKDFIPMSLALNGYNPGISFLTDWTFYYWAFWLSWAPFTGIFIARISQGRSIAQTLLGVMVIPSIGTFFWFTTFGTAAFEVLDSLSQNSLDLSNVFTSIFIFLEQYPLGIALCVVTLVLLVGFLVTSLDSAVFVLSMFTDRGKQNPSKTHKVLWSIVLLLSTTALLILGEVKSDINVLTAIQKILIITSLPFSFLLVLLMASFLWRLKRNPKTSVKV